MVAAVHSVAKSSLRQKKKKHKEKNATAVLPLDKYAANKLGYGKSALTSWVKTSG